MAIGKWPVDNVGNFVQSHTHTHNPFETNASRMPTTCELYGHDVQEWAEYLDGVVAGSCSVCLHRIVTRRMPGGLPILRLKALVERMLASPDDVSASLELQEVADLLEAEQRELNAAKALLADTRKMGRWSQ